MRRTALLLVIAFLFSATAVAADAAADKDAANRAAFEKECAALIKSDGPCAQVKAGGGGRRGCVSKPENLDKATPGCKAVIEEWKALPKK